MPSGPLLRNLHTALVGNHTATTVSGIGERKNKIKHSGSLNYKSQKLGILQLHLQLLRREAQFHNMTETGGPSQGNKLNPNKK